MPRNRQSRPPLRLFMPSVLEKEGLFRCPRCAGDGCKWCGRGVRRGYLLCAHPLALLGTPVEMGDEVETIRMARCSRCGSHVRDPRPQAGDDAADVLHTRNGDDADAPESFQNAGRV